MKENEWRNREGEIRRRKERQIWSLTLQTPLQDHESCEEDEEKEGDWKDKLELRRVHGREGEFISFMRRLFKAIVQVYEKCWGIARTGNFNQQS